MGEGAGMVEGARTHHVKPVAPDPFLEFVVQGQVYRDKLPLHQHIRAPHHRGMTILDDAIMLAAFGMIIKCQRHAPDQQMKMGRELALVFTALADLNFQFPDGNGFGK